MNKEKEINKYFQIKNRRARAALEDSEELQDKRKLFLEWLQARAFPKPIEALECYKFEDGKDVKTQFEIFQYFNPLHNLRSKLKTETCAEIDKLDFEKAIDVICKICLSLIQDQVHFACFYSEGSRSVHLRIYDFQDLEDLSPFHRELAQLQFWRKHAGIYAAFLDKAVWRDEQLLAIEFSIHFKHGTKFDLLFEHIPCKK